MSWTTLQAKGGVCVELGYSIQRAGAKKPVQMHWMICAELMAQCGWNEETRLVLQVGKDEDAGQGRLCVDARRGRKMLVLSLSGRGSVRFGWTETEEVYFPDAGLIQELEWLHADKDGISFKLPVETRCVAERCVLERGTV